MAARVLLAKGARGELVRRVQLGLKAKGHDPRGDDGVYGDDTAAAVSAFRAANGLGASRDVDGPTWKAVTGTPIPPVRDRVLQVTAAFEGHGFTLAQGNFDGAGITWGVIGFTLRHGQIPSIVLELERTRPAVIRNAFGAKAEELLRMMRASKQRQLAWADGLSVGPSKTRLREPWRTAFRTLGQTSEAQAQQISRAVRGYFQPALRTAAELGLRTELGIALCFDVHVQNGSVTPRAREELRRDLAAHPVRNERELRILIANAVADTSKPRWREDVRSRKLTLATGAGRVHGRTYVIKNWGLGDVVVRGL